MQQRGFTLVELSIVLVIIGLLAGEILGGQSFIRAAEMRTVSTDMQRSKAGYNVGWIVAAPTMAS
jgi:prepilin-type N-terminal cleavage/methylation domain-containing protein